MKIVVDAPKRAANLAKHKLDLADAAAFDWVGARYVEARQGRQKAIGRLREAIVVVIFRRLGSEAIGVISLRPASRKERALHDQR